MILNNLDSLALFLLGLVGLFTIVLVKNMVVMKSRGMTRLFLQPIFCIATFAAAAYAIVRSIETVLLMVWKMIRPIMQPHLLQIFALITGFAILFIFAKRLGIIKLRKNEAVS